MGDWSMGEGTFLDLNLGRTLTMMSTTAINQRRPSLREVFDQLGSFLNQERALLWGLLAYAIVVGLFSLIVPITVQELVNTFAFSVSPIMVVTLVGIMAGILLFVGIFRVLQFYATDILERRVFVRITLALAKILPRFKKGSFQVDAISRFFETVLLQRALSSLLVDLINVLIGGLIGMTLLALYHPYFVIFDVVLVGSVVLIAILGKGGLRTTLQMSQAKYAVFHWFQEVAENLLHFKSTNCSDLILNKADHLATTYVKARESRFGVLVRQYISSIVLQVFLHTGLLGTAGWLLSQGELTLGQLVAAEVIVASLLLNLESVVKRAYIVFYFFTALTELDHLFSLPQDTVPQGSDLSLPQSSQKGLHLTCTRLFLPSAGPLGSQEIQFEARPGDHWGIVCPTESVRYQVSLALSGLEPPLAGTLRYNGVDLRSLSGEEIAKQRGLVFGRDLTLFEGSVADNITMKRKGIGSEELLWALGVAQLEKEFEEWPQGLETQVAEGGKDLTPSQRLRILIARAIIMRPSLLILDGALHEIPEDIREDIFHRLASKEMGWTLVIVTTDPNVKNFVEKVMPLNVL